MTGRPKKPAIDRFSNLYEVDSTSQCWNWSGAKDKDGYGFFRDENTKQVKAHRWSYKYHNGNLQNGMVICHSCDNPSCVNPQHLWQGTHQDNENDKDAKNRRKGAHIGTGNHCVVLTEKEVIEIWNSNDTKADLGRAYGVSESTIRKIHWGQTWKHLNLGDKRNGKMGN